eukprot:CAMPEP_0181298820 /NCGR_PEP_ID=MMETSP1101-20121128/5992_1 /TAXON_ID=46948 /ORGANISM="Rhodomonas abbreviata, Strain Caron Lab Isolate" /LENGTH=127 /DNA_ID=CAMNT_0023403879 /DNA_START=31 /DNA_END=414 /DNA_ORIENTATION=+
MPSRDQGGFSRSVHHGNMMNKKGCSAMYQKSLPNKSARKNKVQQLSQSKKVIEVTDTVIEAANPQTAKSPKLEKRFSIPNVAENANITGQAYLRSHTKLAVLHNEFKTNMKVRSFSQDQDHEIEVIA